MSELASPTFDSQAKARLVRFYERYNPQQLHRIDEILDAYDHDVEQLFRDLVERYGPEPPLGQQGLTNADETQQNLNASTAHWRSASMVALPEENATDGGGGGDESNRPPPLSLMNLSLVGGDRTRWAAHDTSSPAHGAAVEQVGDASSPYLAKGDASMVVYDDAYSPSRRHVADRLGHLFLPSQEVDGSTSASAVPRAATVTNSDVLVAATTAAVYRKDPRTASQMIARHIVDSAKQHAASGPLATRTLQNMQRAIAADVFDSRIEEMEGATFNYIGDRSVSLSTIQRSIVVPPPAALSHTLNVDEVSSYQVLANAQRNGQAPVDHPLLRASKPVGGMFFSGDSMLRQRGGAHAADITTPMMSNVELARLRLRRLQTSPLVAQVGARNRELMAAIDDAVVHRSGANEDGTSEGDDGIAVSMICVRCGKICKIVPGKEHLYDHSH